MIVIRNVFRLKFGKAREAVALMKDGLAIQKRAVTGVDFSTRMLTDVTGPFYTLVLELTVSIWLPLKATPRDSLGTKSGRRTAKSSDHWWSPGTADFYNR